MSNIDLYNTYYKNMKSTFMLLDEKKGVEIARLTFKTSFSKENLFSNLNKEINKYDDPIKTIGLSRYILSCNEDVRGIFYLINYNQSHPTKLISEKFFIENKTYKEISKETNFKINTIKSYIHRFRTEYSKSILNLTKTNNINTDNITWIV